MNKEIEIPEGYEAKIEDNKVIFVPKESKEEKIRKWIIHFIEVRLPDAAEFESEYRAALAYLEKQKEQKPESCDCSRDEESYTNGIHHVLMNPEAYGLIKPKPAEWSEEDEQMIGHLDEVLEHAYNNSPHYLAHYCTELNVWIRNKLNPMRPYRPQSLADAFKKVVKDKDTALAFLKDAGIVDENGELAVMYRGLSENLSVQTGLK